MMTTDIVEAEGATPLFRFDSPEERNMKTTPMRFAAAPLAPLSGLVAASTPALSSAPQIQNQAPGYFRLKVGDLEVTALYDAAAVFELSWLKGKKATIDGVAKALQQDPHLLDAADLGFLVNTGKQLILVDAGAGTWYGGGGLRRPGGRLPTARPPPAHNALASSTHPPP